MSYLNGPRINFWGGGSTNVDTANNDGNGIVDLVNASVTSTATDDEIIAQLRSPATSGGKPYFTVAGWNYYGDHQVAFRGAAVSSAGAPGSVGTGDATVGLPVSLLGSVDPVSGDGPYGGAFMADLDPTSSVTTQIYVGGLMMGGGGGAEPALLVRADTRCHSHLLGLRYDRTTTAPPYATPGSAFANGTFQLAFPRASIVRYDPTLATLAAIVDAPGAIGIVVRFCMFEFYPGMSTAQLRESYDDNYNDPNPSLGRIIGTIGPWFPDEPGTCPAGRLLANQNLGGAQGVAHLDAAAGRLTLDLSSALQGKAIRQNPTGITQPIGPNVDYGNLVVSAAGTDVASTPSLPDTYYLYGGVYDLELDAAGVQAVQQNPISIRGTTATLDVREEPVRLFSDDRNVYLDDLGGAASITLIARHLGGPVPSDLQVALGTAASGTLPDAGFLSFPATVTVAAGTDRVAFTVTDGGGDAGFLSLNFTAVGADSGYFVNFRKYPAEDYTGVTPTWELVYEQCLRYYYVVFPAMSKRIPLNDQPTIAATSGEILKRLSPRYHDTTLRMPVTRSMPPAKVALLQAYLKGLGAGGG